MAHTTEVSITTLLGPDKASERRGKLARDDSVLANKLLNSGSNTVCTVCVMTDLIVCVCVRA